MGVTPNVSKKAKDLSNPFASIAFNLIIKLENTISPAAGCEGEELNSTVY